MYKDTSSYVALDLTSKVRSPYMYGAYQHAGKAYFGSAPICYADKKIA